MRSAVVFIGGDPPHRGVVARLPAERIVIAADSGLNHAYALGVDVDLLVGDLDSVTPGEVARAIGQGVDVEQHPVNKDATDTELAIEAALNRGCDHLVVVSGGGGRFDHEVGALMAMSRPSLNGIDVEAWWGSAYMKVIHGPDGRTVDGAPGMLISLVPLHGDALGVIALGVRYPLNDETLWAGSSRGLSNEFIGRDMGVRILEGTLLVVVPEALEPNRFEGEPT